MYDIHADPPVHGLLIIRVWQEPDSPRLRVVAKADVTADDGEERHAFGSVDDALAFCHTWLDQFTR